MLFDLNKDLTIDENGNGYRLYKKGEFKLELGATINTAYKQIVFHLMVLNASGQLINSLPAKSAGIYENQININDEVSDVKGAYDKYVSAVLTGDNSIPTLLGSWLVVDLPLKDLLSAK